MTMDGNIPQFTITNGEVFEELRSSSVKDTGKWLYEQCNKTGNNPPIFGSLCNAICAVKSKRTRLLKDGKIFVDEFLQEPFTWPKRRTKQRVSQIPKDPPPIDTAMGSEVYRELSIELAHEWKSKMRELEKKDKIVASLDKRIKKTRQEKKRAIARESYYRKKLKRQPSLENEDALIDDDVDNLMSPITKSPDERSEVLSLRKRVKSLTEEVSSFKGKDIVKTYDEATHQFTPEMCRLVHDLLDKNVPESSVADVIKLCADFMGKEIQRIPLEAKHCK